MAPPHGGSQLPARPGRPTGGHDDMIRRRVARGALSNYAARIVGLGSWFFLAPIILHRLGSVEYGLWALIGSVIAYGWLLDLGVATTLVKYVAELRARDEADEARALIASALSLYLVLGVVAVVVSGALAVLLPPLLQLPGTERTTAAWLIVLMGVSVGVSLPCSTGPAILRGLHRYDLASAIGTGGTLLSTGGGVLVLLVGGGLLGMVAVNIPVTLASQAVATWAIGRLAPELQVGLRGASWRLARRTVSYSTPLSAIDVADLLQRKTDEMVIGGFLAVGAVTPFTLARGLGELGRTLTSQFVQVLLPVASELEARNDLARLRALYVNATRLALAMFWPVAISLFVFGGPILSAWVGPEQAGAANLVVILTCSSLLATSQSPARWILQGINRHRWLAPMALAAGLANVGLSIALVGRFGLVGVALGTLVPTALESLLLVLPYAARVLGVRLSDGLRHVLAPTLPAALAQFVVLLAAARTLAPAGLPMLLVVLGGGGLVYGGVYLAVGASAAERAMFRRGASTAVGRLRLAVGRGRRAADRPAP